jgi:hypothetical protein
MSKCAFDLIALLLYVEKSSAIMVMAKFKELVAWAAAAAWGAAQLMKFRGGAHSQGNKLKNSET